MLDALDHQLLGLLRVNARTPTATLARKLGVSRGTIANRIARLEASGVIAGYSVQIRAHSQPSGIHAWISIAVEGDKTRDGGEAPARRALGKLASTPTVDGICWPRCMPRRSPRLSEVLERFRKIKGIGTPRPAFIASIQDVAFNYAACRSRTRLLAPSVPPNKSFGSSRSGTRSI